MVMGWIIAIDNYPRTRKMGIGNVVHHILENNGLEVAIEETSHAYGKAQICRRMTSGNEDGINTTKILWLQNLL